MKNIWILAEAAQESGQSVKLDQANTNQGTNTVEDGSQTPQPEDGKTAKKPGLTNQLLIMVPIFLIMYFLLFRGPKKKEQKHSQMVKSLQKNDKVQTIGGIIGTIVDIRENEIVLKIDESNNTKMRISKRAIASTLSEQ